jgi:putative ABC transport system permease protein
MKFAKLVQRIVLRNVREERFLTALSVLGVALGVGLFMGVNVAANRAQRSFETNMQGLDPAFHYEVVNTSGIDFPEQVYKTVKAVAGKVLPVLTINAYVPGADETVEIDGIYTPAALDFLSAASTGKIGLEDFFKEHNGVLITKRFAVAHRIKQGDTLRAIVYSREYGLRITGVLDAPLLPENRVFMDLGNFQEYLGMAGSLTRIDVAADEKLAQKIDRILPLGLAIEQKQKMIKSQKSLVDSFRSNLRFVTFLAVLVGVFLLYNTVFISVVKRRKEIGILRGLGMDRKTVVALFSAQGMVLGFAGSLLGIVFGQACAWFSVMAMEKTITRFYGAVNVTDFLITRQDALRTLMLGLGVSLLASIVPALEAARVRPNESSQEGTAERAYRGRQMTFSVIGVLFILCGGMISYIDFRFVPFDFPWLSYGGIVLLILGCTFNAPVYLGACLKAVKRPLAAVFKTGARIAVGDTRGNRHRFSLALMSVAVSSALIVATVASVHSFKASFIEWIDTYITGDIYIKPASCASNFCFHPLPDEVVRSIEGLPGVENTGRFRALLVDLHGQKVVAGFGNSSSLWQYRPRISSDEKERLKRLAYYRELSISDYLAVKYGLKKGDTVELTTPKGRIAFTVNNAAISYSTMSGFLYMDRRWLKEYWGLDDATQLSVYLAKGWDAGRFKKEIGKALGKKYALEITDNAELRRDILGIFDKSFALTYTIELIAIVISLIGVVNALLILVFERKREIAVLRYLGASWRQIRDVMALTAGILGSAGTALGAVMGWAISIVITHVINRISFGWEVALRAPLLTLAALTALLIIATTAAGLVPAYLARKVDPKAFISFE